MSKINHPLPSKDVLRPGDVYMSGRRRPYRIEDVRENDFSYGITSYGKKTTRHVRRITHSIRYDHANEMDGIFLRETEGKLEVVALSAKSKKDWPQ